MGEYSNLKPDEQYNYWTIIKYFGKNKFGKDAYECKCICGKISIIEGRSLVKNLSKSCGCVNRVPKDVQANRIKIYKQKYYEDNKERLSKKNCKYLKEKRIVDQEKYGIDIYNLRSKYHMKIEEYFDILKKQNNKCAICGTIFNTETKYMKPYVDHDHKTDQVRGLICMNCNSALGHFKDDIQILKKAITYLEDSNEKSCDDSRN